LQSDPIKSTAPAIALGAADIARARFEYEGRLGESIVQKRGLLLWALTSSAINLLLTVALFVLLPLKTIQPYVVEVNKLSGEARAAEVAVSAKNYRPDDATKSFWLSEFAKGALTIDPRRDVTEENIRQAGAKARGKAATQLADYLRRTQPIKTIMEDPDFSRRVTVRAVTFLKNANTATVQLQTEDLTRGRSSELRRYIVKLDYAFAEPTSTAEILQNPLGMFVIDFAINEDIK